MDVIVCVKQVPDTTEIKIDPETNTLVREGVPCIMNPFDSYAVEEAVRIKEKTGGVVKVLTMGPPQSEEVLREAVAMGADEGVLLCDKVFAGSDTLATASALSSAIKQIGKFSLVICGKQAIDGDTAQVGPEMAELLGVPFMSYVRKISALEEKRVRVERLTDDGYQTAESPLPAVITVVKEINQPRLPSLKGKMRAKKMEFEIMNFDKLGGDSGRYGLNGSPTWVKKVFSPEPRKGGEMLEGAPEEQASLLLKRLKETKLI
jgi:electron transfer flavoprotein beta subunit